MTVRPRLGKSLSLACAIGLGIAGPALAHDLGSYWPGLNLGEDGQVSIITVQVKDRLSDIKRLRDHGYAIAGIDLENNSVDVMTHTPDQSSALSILGFLVTGKKQIDTKAAPDTGYKTPEESAEALRLIAEAHPGIARLESLGKSVENRDIWAIKISDNPEVRELDEPTVMFNAMHHAREVMTTEVALDIAEYLASRYGSDADVTRWVENNEIWIVPQVNPDGSAKVWGGNNMWRKNARGGYGVDINRNYSYAWNGCNGSSGSTYADDYRGPSAASEPETKAMMNFAARIQPVFSISYHTYSELVLYPYGCNNSRTETRAVVEKVGGELASSLVRDSGSGTYTPGTPWELLYAVDGGDIDWLYHEHNTIAYAIEVNASRQGFQPPYRWRQPSVEKMRAGWQLLLNRLEQSGVRGFVADGAGRARPQATITVESMVGQQPTGLPPVLRTKADGTYHLVLNPGMYRLGFAAGGRTIVKEVTVGSGRVQLDVEL